MSEDSKVISVNEDEGEHGDENEPLISKGTPNSGDARIAKTVCLNDAVNEVGNGAYQAKIGLVCGLAEAANGVQQLSVGFLIHHLGNLFHLTNPRKALVGTVSGAGMLVGSTAFGRASDLWGRRYAFIVTLLISGTFGLLCAASPTYDSFLLMRFMLSIGIGGNVPLTFTIFTEFSARQNRGGYLTLLEAFWSGGAVISCLLAWAILASSGWQWYVVSVSLPALVLGLWAIRIMPETPRFLLVAGDTEGAEAVFSEMASTNGRQDMANSKLVKSEATFEESSFLQLFVPSQRATTVVLFALYFMLSFGCGIFVWMPVLLQEKKLELMSMYRSMVIMALSQIPGVIFAAYVVETAGRRKAISFFFFMGAATTSMFALSESEHVVVISTILMEFFLAGANGCLSAYTVEIYPTTLRSSAMGACSSLSRLSSVVNPTIWALLLDIGPQTAIFTGAGSLVFGTVLIWLLAETKGKDLADHQKKD